MATHITLVFVFYLSQRQKKALNNFLSSKFITTFHSDFIQVGLKVFVMFSTIIY